MCCTRQNIFWVGVPRHCVDNFHVELYETIDLFVCVAMKPRYIPLRFRFFFFFLMKIYYEIMFFLHIAYKSNLIATFMCKCVEFSCKMNTFFSSFAVRRVCASASLGSAIYQTYKHSSGVCVCVCKHEKPQAT